MLITVTHSPCPTDQTPFSYDEGAFIDWVDEVFCEGYKREDSDLEGRPQTLEDAMGIVENAGYHLQLRK